MGTSMASHGLIIMADAEPQEEEAAGGGGPQQAGHGHHVSMLPARRASQDRMSELRRFGH